MSGKRLKMPTRDVAFAPTEVFARHWQDEVKAQSALYNKPTWAVEEEKAPAPPKALSPEELTVPLSEVWKLSAVVFLLGLGAGYLIGEFVHYVGQR